MGAITISRTENLPIGQVAQHSGVNIETIRYYERIKIYPLPHAPQAAAGFMDQQTFEPSPSYGDRAI
jgi:MerR family transcriptional regulator, mercuric resistance operon regulatory protein